MNNMYFQKKYLILILLLNIWFPCFLSGSGVMSKQIVVLEISGLRSTKGSVLIGVFIDHESYQKEIPFKKIKFDKRNISNRNLIVSIELEAGIYGFTLLDDENENGKMEYSYIGVPKEGFGFSEYYHKGLKRPHFDIFKQEVVKNKSNKFRIMVKYM